MDKETNTTPDQRPEYTPPDLSGGAGLPSKRRKKILLLLLAVVLLIASAFAVRFFVLKDDGKDKAPKQSNSTPSPEDKNQEPAPYAIAYSSGNPSAGATTRFRILKDKVDTSAMSMGKEVYTSHAVVNKNQVALATSGRDSGGDGAAVWYSKDSGKTYKKLFGAKAGSEGSLGAQITSLAFSSDGKAVVFGFLPDIAGKNTVKEVDLETGEEEDLFSVDERGVFVEAYDRAGKKLYYYAGCYNCDGNKMNKLLVRYVDKNIDGIVHEDADRIGARTVFNDDLSKVLILKMDPSEDGIGYGSEGVIEEVTVANGLVREVIPPLDEEGTMGEIGYVDSSERIYFAKGDVLYTATGDNSISKLYEAPATILAVHYVSENRAVVSTGEYSAFSVVDFDLATQKTKEILKGETNTYVFGVTWK